MPVTLSNHNLIKIGKGKYRNPIFLAREWRRSLDNGEYVSPAALARHVNVSRARVTQIMNLLKAIKRDTDASILFITHDIALASDLCDKIAVMYAAEIVEIDSIEGVLENPKHPYTQKLIASVPLLRGERTPDFIPGAPPDLVNPPPGCRFHPRCPHAMDVCKTDPPLKEREGEGSTLCWLYEKRIK